MAQLDLACAQLSPREECNRSSDVSDAEQIVHSPHRTAALQNQARVHQHILTSNLQSLDAFRCRRPRWRRAIHTCKTAFFISCRKMRCCAKRRRHKVSKMRSSIAQTWASCKQSCRRRSIQPSASCRWHQYNSMSGKFGMQMAVYKPHRCFADDGGIIADRVGGCQGCRQRSTSKSAAPALFNCRKHELPTG